MKSIGKLSLLVSGFSLIAALGARYILGAWLPILYIFLGLFIAGLIFSLIWDYKFYLEVFSLKTTKDSLSLGWSLCFLIIFLTAVGFLGLRFNKTFDLTEEGINSLSLQSQDILKTLDEDLFVRIFYNGDKISDEARFIKNNLQDNLSLYKQESFKVKIRFINSYTENALAEKYLSDLVDKKQKEVFVFVEYKGRRVRVVEPFTEESLTSAVIKVRKREKKEIYFLVGHGERDLRDDKADGIKTFEQYLLDSAFELKEWSFIQDGEPQTPPALVMIIGPRRPFLQGELNWLKDYLQKGGRVLMALDPGEKHNLQEFLKQEFQLDFQNNFIVSQIGYMYGGITKALGLFFDRLNSITKRFQDGKDFVLFEKASVVDVTPKALETYKVSYLLKSHQNSFSVPRLTEKIKVGDFNQQSMAVEISPKQKTPDKEPEASHQDHSEDEPADAKSADSESSQSKKKAGKEEKKSFRLVVFGDSDFLANKYFYQGINRDLALNTVVSLLDEEELISIRPKNPKKTEITLTRNHWLGLVILFIVIPLAFIFASFLMWYKRRQA